MTWFICCCCASAALLLLPLFFCASSNVFEAFFPRKTHKSTWYCKKGHCVFVVQQYKDAFMWNCCRRAIHTVWKKWLKFSLMINWNEPESCFHRKTQLFVYSNHAILIASEMMLAQCAFFYNTFCGLENDLARILYGLMQLLSFNDVLSHSRLINVASSIKFQSVPKRQLWVIIETANVFKDLWWLQRSLIF